MQIVAMRILLRASDCRGEHRVSNAAPRWGCAVDKTIDTFDGQCRRTNGTRMTTHIITSSHFPWHLHLQSVDAASIVTEDPLDPLAVQTHGGQ